MTSDPKKQFMIWPKSGLSEDVFVDLAMFVMENE